MVSRDIQDIFIRKYKNKEFNDAGLLEIVGASFLATDPSIFGVVNETYVKKEIMWYNSKSRNVYDMHNPPDMWKNVADDKGNINSNYGWCIYSEDNGRQYAEVLTSLRENPNTRQAMMIYTRPTMHEDSKANGMYDFMCTNAVTYRIEKDRLSCVVQMRSNDIVYGYKNDYAWQLHVLQKLAKDLVIEVGDIYWQTASLHMYPRHFYMIEDLL